MPFPVESKYMEETERKLGVVFPASYRRLMELKNGGEVETDDDTWVLYPFFDNSDRTRLKRAFNDIVRETELARQWTGFPEDGVAIGDNGSGDKLILLPELASAGTLGEAIFMWNHETRETSRVAEDFSQLR
jgi:hypothetical protein